MESFHIANDVSLWSFGEDQTTACSNALGSVQTAPEFDWNLGDPLGDIYWNVGAFVTNGGAAPVDPAATSTIAFDTSFTYPHDHPCESNQMRSDLSSPCPGPTPLHPPTGGNSVVSSQSNASWYGDIPSTTEEGAEPYGGLIPSTSGSVELAIASQQGFSWFNIPGQFDGTATTDAYFAGDRATMGPYVPYFDVSGVVYTPSCESTELSAPSLGAAGVGDGRTMSYAVYTPASSKTVLRKRPRGADENNGDPFEDVYDDQRRKKAKKDDNGVLRMARRTSRARRKPSTKTPKESNNKSEVAGSGAERLAPLDAHELYHRFLPGSSVQKESAEATVVEKLPWVEGREKEDVARGLFRIPKRFSERYRQLLKATPEDWARGAVRERKCRLCPGADFSTWNGFKRHCDRTEGHPQRMSFCSYCGDCFARTDSLARHRKHRPPSCLIATPEEAQTKRRNTENAHVEFQEKFESYLGTKEVIETPFAQTIMEMFPGSSKRGSRQQSRLKAPKSEAS